MMTDIYFIQTRDLCLSKFHLHQICTTNRKNTPKYAQIRHFLTLLLTKTGTQICI